MELGSGVEMENHTDQTSLSQEARRLVNVFGLATVTPEVITETQLANLRLEACEKTAEKLYYCALFINSQGKLLPGVDPEELLKDAFSEIKDEMEAIKSQGVFIPLFDPQSEEKLELNSLRQLELARAQARGDGLTPVQYRRQQELTFLENDLARQEKTPPIASGTVFSAREELDKIRQIGSLGEKKSAITRFKERLAYQTDGYGLLGERLLMDWLNDPTLTKNDVLETIQKFRHRYGFSESDLALIRSIVEDSFNRKRLIAELKDQYPDTRQRVQALLDFDIKGEATIEDRGFTVFVYLDDEDMADFYAKAKGVTKLKPSDESKEKLQAEIKKVVPEGYTFPTKFGFHCMVLRKNASVFTRNHEFQHAYYYLHRDTTKILEHEDFEVASNRVNTLEAAAVAPDAESKKMYLQASLRGSNIAFTNMAKDEILAHEKGGTNGAEIISKLTGQNGSEYDYRATIRKNLPAVVEKLGGEVYRQMVLEEFNRIIESEYDTTVEEAVRAFEDLKKAGFSTDQIIQILTVRPLNKWGKTVRRLIQIRQN